MPKLNYRAVIFICVLMMGCACAKDVICNLTVKNNSAFSIAIRSNPTTGYSWKIAKISNPAAAKKISSNYIPDKTAPRVCGSGGNEIWKFKAIRPGQTSIEFTYQRPWEKNIPPVEKKKYLVKVVR